jgi:L-histidine N-alpha-methyltransferase
MPTRRLQIHGRERARHRRATMAREIRAGLARAPRSIPPKYFYDDAGSRLFDAICHLPEYYLTRAERALLERHAHDVIAWSGARTLVEIGSGMARKTGLLVHAMCAAGGEARYVPFDIAPEAIEASARSLLPEHPRLRVHGVVGDFGADLGAVAQVAPPGDGARLFAFLGSTLGNLDEREAPALLKSIAALMQPGERFLLGVDLVKDERTLEAAYDDAQGVTAAFNKNVLRVLARELDGDFDPDAFDHRALYDAGRERIEMHLVARRAHRVRLCAIDLDFELGAGESILTEISRKFTRASVERTLGEAGMTLERWLPAEDGAFALALATADPRPV